MYYTLKKKICSGNDEMEPVGFDQYKYSRSSAKSRRTVICRISVHQNHKKGENESEINQDKTNNDHELTNLGNCSKTNETPNPVTYL